MEINWLQSHKNYQPNMADLIHLEYQLRSFLMKGIIQEAEHLAHYMHYISLNFDTDVKKFTVSSKTPEPFFSFISYKVATFNLQGW